MAESRRAPMFELSEAAQAALVAGARNTLPVQGLTHKFCALLTWPIPPEITDAELERRLFTPAGFHEGSTKPLPDWTKVHEELKRRGVTLMILWEEHRAAYVDGHGYSRYVAP
jgi:transposase